MFKLLNSEVRIEPTNHCNANCIMCPREKMTRPQGAMNFGLYKKIIDQCVEAGAKIVSLENYGESFLDPRLFVKAEYARAAGLKTLTITNGSLINEKTYLPLASLFDRVRISLYAMTKKTFDSIHKGLDFDNIVGNIDRLLNMPRNNLKVYMYFLLLEENKHELVSWLEKYELLSDGVSVWKPHNWGDGREYRKGFYDKESCNRPFTGSLQVQWDGKVVPCCFDYNNAVVLGDFNKQTLEEIMNSEEYNDLREAHLNRDFDEYPFCDGCDQLDKRKDVLIYSNIQEAKVGKQNTNFFDLRK